MTPAASQSTVELAQRIAAHWAAGNPGPYQDESIPTDQWFEAWALALKMKEIDDSR